jgi:hypothetical protein
MLVGVLPPTFLLSRLFDIVKPPPVRRGEKISLLDEKKAKVLSVCDTRVAAPAKPGSRAVRTTPRTQPAQIRIGTRSAR